MSELTSLSGAARWLNRPERPLRELVKRGDLVPDSRMGRFLYFRMDKLEEIRDLLDKRASKPRPIS